MKSLTFCKTFSCSCPTFYHPFSQSPFCGRALEMTLNKIFVVFSRPFILLSYLSRIIAFVGLCVPQSSASNILKMHARSPILSIKGASFDHNTQTCYLNPIDFNLYLSFIFCLMLNGISTFIGYLMPNPPFLKNNSGTI